jgi:predicted nucleotidyltransferase
MLDDLQVLSAISIAINLVVKVKKILSKMDFNTLSSKKKILLRYHNKLYTKTLFKLDEQGKIKKCYWTCIHKEFEYHSCDSNFRY